jgi:MYXO-CTERM domain-containing protein
MLNILLSSALAASPKIVNGSKEAGFPSVVSLGVEAGDNRFSACSGNLITPRIVLTAAHCSSDIPMDVVLEWGTTFFGANIDDYDASVGFEGGVIHPDYVPLDGAMLPDNDVAVLILEQDAPVEPTWIVLRDFVNAEDTGADVVSVGFGSTGADGNGSGTKRSAEMTVDGFRQGFIISESATNPDGSQICSGDSGGPMFHLAADGVWEQWGVHSWGDQDCLVSSGSTRIDKQRDWILEQVVEVHGTADFCEINGWYGDGLCDERCELQDPDCVEELDSGDTGEPSIEEPKGRCSSAPGGAPWLAAGLAGLLLLRRRATA